MTDATTVVHQGDTITTTYRDGTSDESRGSLHDATDHAIRVGLHLDFVGSDGRVSFQRLA